MFPRCVTKRGQPRRAAALWRVFQPVGGRWRGIAHVPNGNLRLRDEWRAVDARARFAHRSRARCGTSAPAPLVEECICGDIMAGIARPALPAVRQGVRPDNPVGACMVSSEGTCRIWHQYGGPPIGERCGGERMNTAGDRAHRAEARRRQPRHALADPARVRRRRRAQRAGWVGCARWTTAPPSARRRLAGLHHRLSRGAAAVLPGRRHRPARDLRHGERSRDDGGTEVLGLTCGVDPRGGLSARGARARAALDRGGLPRGRRAHRHRRHQGDGQGRARRHRHQHLGRGA